MIASKTLMKYQKYDAESENGLKVMLISMTIMDVHL